MSLFITCPVENVERATTFYTALGWTLNAEMSDHNVSCFAIASDQSASRSSVMRAASTRSWKTRSPRAWWWVTKVSTRANDCAADWGSGAP
ncbi:VOC family protein [Rhodococcus qingshengii]|uniref:VOC family protein n=1 Tax=Rhodococcus qingshengii TaxID=334542 RepID=UPI003F6D9EA5